MLFIIGIVIPIIGSVEEAEEHLWEGHSLQVTSSWLVLHSAVGMRIFSCRCQ